MNQLKQLIKEVESLIEYAKIPEFKKECLFELKGIKQTVEAVYNQFQIRENKQCDLGIQWFKDWQSLKKLLGVK